MVDDVTDLASADLGTFDFFLDVGCLQGFNAEQQRAVGAGITELANSGAALLILAFQPTRIRTLTGALSQTEVQEALPAWDLLSVDLADTAGLGWPLNRTAPHWLGLRLNT